MRALLDVNVLIALLDSRHVHHRLATEWLGRNLKSGWASCPLTQNGCLRSISQPSYPNRTAIGLVARHLGEAVAGPDHAFWPDYFSLLEPGVLAWERILGPRQVPDAYLLSLAVNPAVWLVT